MRKKVLEETKRSVTTFSYQTATHNQRINITVLIEALCPDCQRFIVDELYPNVYKNFAGFVNIEFVPYGNAKVVNGTIQCQHGPEECSINRFESCLIDSVQTQEQYVPLIYCIENNLRVLSRVATRRTTTRESSPANSKRVARQAPSCPLGGYQRCLSGKRADDDGPSAIPHMRMVHGRQEDPLLSVGREEEVQD
ncbi:gamma interferon inducible lysosomal thiol reductase, partial [Ancylostoma caninum]